MTTRTRAALGLSALCLGAALLPAALLPTRAIAGPCSDQIADLGRKLAQSPSLGPVTSGTLSGSNPTAAAASQPGAPTAAGTSADNRLGGTAGTKEANANLGNNIATSPQDVRRQQEGLPTAAAAAAGNSKGSVETVPGKAGSPEPNDRMSEAKMELERARMLDQGNDTACNASLDRTRQLMD